MPPKRSAAAAKVKGEVVQAPQVEEKKPVVAATTKPKVKREKKPVQVVAVVTPNGIEGSFTPEPRKPLICHLPFESKEVKFSDQPLRYDPTPPIQDPEPFTDKTYFGVESNVVGKEGETTTFAFSDTWTMEHQDEANAKESTQVQPMPTEVRVNTVNSQAATSSAAWKQLGDNFKRCELMTYYKNGASFEIPNSTPYHCFWCSLAVEGVPCFLPMREEKGSFHIYGNFCSPQCALAYVLKENLDPHIRWERMALLHRLYRPKAGGRLYPSPPRESLARFGGPFTDDEYRQIIAENKVRVDFQMPPLVSILGSLDTKPIDFYDSSLQNTFTQGLTAIQERIGKPSDGTLRLKRSKPLKDKDSTLDSCMQIQVRTGVGRSGLMV